MITDPVSQTPPQKPTIHWSQSLYDVTISLAYPSVSQLTVSTGQGTSLSISFDSSGHRYAHLFDLSYRLSTTTPAITAGSQSTDIRLYKAERAYWHRLVAVVDACVKVDYGRYRDEDSLDDDDRRVDGVDVDDGEGEGVEGIGEGEGEGVGVEGIGEGKVELDGVEYDAKDFPGYGRRYESDDSDIEDVGDFVDGDVIAKSTGLIPANIDQDIDDMPPLEPKCKDNIGKGMKYYR